MKIVWLKTARSELQSIQRYLRANAGEKVAQDIVHRIVQSGSALAHDPWLGHPSESTSGIHELQVARLPYLLPYRVIDHRVEILRVFHQSQEPPVKWTGR